MFLFLWGSYTGVELLNFFKLAPPVYVLTAEYEHLFSNFLNTCWVFFLTTILVRVKCYLIVLSICICLQVVMWNIFSCAYWPVVCVCNFVEKYLFKSFPHLCPCLWWGLLYSVIWLCIVLHSGLFTLILDPLPYQQSLGPISLCVSHISNEVTFSTKWNTRLTENFSAFRLLAWSGRWGVLFQAECFCRRGVTGQDPQCTSFHPEDWHLWHVCPIIERHFAPRWASRNTP